MSRLAFTLGTLALATLTSAPALAQVSAQVTIPFPPFVMPVPQATPAAPPPAYPARPQVVYDDPGYADPGYHRPMRVRQPAWGANKLGLDLRLDGAAGFGAGRAGSAYGMGGAGIGLRYRAFKHLGFEGGFDLIGGRDYNDAKRFELIGSAGGLVFFNPRSRVQVYLSTGMLVDHARTWTDTGYLTYVTPTTTFTHFGGYAGLGLEVFATRNIAFHFDARGVLRQKVGGSSPAPEFTDPMTGRATNTSGGIVGSAGLVIYF